MEDLVKNYKLYIRYLKAYITRDGLDDFLEWLKTTDIINAPASTKYHLSEPGGLVKHSLNVFNRLISLIQNEYGEDVFEKGIFTKETLAFISLLHDVSKINFYEKYIRNVKNQENGQWEQVESYKVREDNNRLVYGIHEENSVYILQNFFKLTHEEALAIRWHGGCGTSNDNTSQSRMMLAYETCPLALYLHIADMMATCIDENHVENNFTLNINKEKNIGDSDEQDSLRPTPETSDCPF